MFLEVLFTEGLNGIRVTVTTCISITLTITAIQSTTNFAIFPYCKLHMGAPYSCFMRDHANALSATKEQLPSPSSLASRASHPRPKNPTVLFEHT